MLQRRTVQRAFLLSSVLACLHAVPGRAASVPCMDDTNKRTGAQGGVSRCLLAENAKFAACTCAKGKMASFYPDGKLKDCYLVEAAVINGISCKDSLALTAEGALRRCRITAPATVGAVKNIPEGSWVSVYKGGALRRLEVAKPTEMMGFRCKGYLNYFHENGKLMKCQLAEDKVVDKTSHKAGDFLCWDSAGTPVADCKRLGKEMLE